MSAEVTCPADRSAPASVRRSRNEEVIVVDARRTVETKFGPLAVRLLGEGPPAVLWHSIFVDEGHGGASRTTWQRSGALSSSPARAMGPVGP